MEKIITDEDYKNWYATLNDDEKYIMNLNTYRTFRNTVPTIARFN